MVTRHFYEEDEVSSALRWCIRTGRTKEALFWCQELLDSEMQESLLKELYEAWLWFFGLGRLSILSSISNLVTNDDILKLVYSIARLPNEARDRSIIILLLHGVEDIQQPDRASWFPTLEPLFQELSCSPLEQAFASATYQGKSRLAFDLSRPLWQENPDRVYEILHEIQSRKHKGVLSEHLTSLQFHEPNLSWPTRACAIASVCLNKKQLQRSLKPIQHELQPDIVACLEEWKSLLGRRKRRIYAIPSECLYFQTKRGCLSNKETTLKNLYALSSESLGTSPFWTRVIEEEAPWLDDDRKEAFYDIYFPDDIPDEWSKEDQEKSHGWGSLINNEVPNYQKYLDRWMRNLGSQGYWSTNRDLQRLCKKEEPDWKSAFEKPWLPTVSTWCLTPVKKRVLVLNDEVS